ncbi:DUF938 domain-containing protein [Chloropicon primus]|uniref:DUF938 domain-containing protein n=1 Tax=Chloropicon primus TaxID=1764295 RepID=A0A5B8MUI6_9CHLO|nr:hypothetical protein A3770_12p67010 [Chloropicon primus]UPR03391.1 DUF938 domain-containing protein [Chloropicon primus]|mmetsp:Transcript_8798/g.25109  ORF Transcript_8798/g.25109 Transcript_8798/m.25109 type:complete len:216 (-) Transcript_8798:1599-2246(-)|eukprot:QDZ24183.1 hypothetical protein A3770_12p67010 [Chloropicon primus]
MVAKLFSGACERNRAPILEVVKKHLLPGRKAKVLEVAAGSGQHAAYLGRHLASDGRVERWYPTDLGMSEEKRASIAAWVEEEGEGEGAGVVAEAVELDTRGEGWAEEWASRGITDMFVANLTHISPFEATKGLMAGAGKILPPGGSIFVYGPFKVDHRHTSDSNAAFDQSLQSRDKAWGYRDVSEIRSQADENGLEFVESERMPANNFTLIFRRR